MEARAKEALPSKLLGAAIALALVAWVIMLVGFQHDGNTRFRWLMAAGVPGLASQSVGLLTIAGRSTRPLLDLAWISGFVPSLPLVLVVAFSALPVPGL